jgi:hypothetical protein
LPEIFLKTRGLRGAEWMGKGGRFHFLHENIIPPSGPATNHYNVGRPRMSDYVQSLYMDSCEHPLAGNIS